MGVREIVDSDVGHCDKASRSGPASLCVVEDDAQRRALATRDGAHAMPHADPVVAALALLRPLAGREDHEGAPRRSDHVRPALRPRALLDQHELAALVVDEWLGQDSTHLEGEMELA